MRVASQLGVSIGPYTDEKWWLVALSAVLHPIISVINLLIYDGGPDSFVFHGNGTMMFLNRLALAAGACTVAASISNSAQGKSWPLLLNGAQNRTGPLPG